MHLLEWQVGCKTRERKFMLFVLFKQIFYILYINDVRSKVYGFKIKVTVTILFRLS